MPARYLHCRTPLQNRAESAYSGDFCSEYCLSHYPAPSRQRTQPTWVKEAAESVVAVQQILKKNHDILRAFKVWNTSNIVASDVPGLTWLEHQGFDFEHHTRLCVNPTGDTEVWCYDEGYRLDSSGKVTPL